MTLIISLAIRFVQHSFHIIFSSASCAHSSQEGSWWRGQLQWCKHQQQGCQLNMKRAQMYLRGSGNLVQVRLTLIFSHHFVRITIE